jgi:hypothetical protein
MALLLPIWHLLFLLSFSFDLCHCLRCYNCTSMLPEATLPQAKPVFKRLLYGLYNVPPVAALCGAADDVEFPTVPSVECPDGDQCARITAQANGIPLQ